MRCARPLRRGLFGYAVCAAAGGARPLASGAGDCILWSKDK